MAPDQIIAEIWDLSWYQVMKVAIYDDFIFMCKIWPGYIFLIVFVVLIRHEKRYGIKEKK